MWMLARHSAAGAARAMQQPIGRICPRRVPCSRAADPLQLRTLCPKRSHCLSWRGMQKLLRWDPALITEHMRSNTRLLGQGLSSQYEHSFRYVNCSHVPISAHGTSHDCNLYELKLPEPLRLSVGCTGPGQHSSEQAGSCPSTRPCPTESQGAGCRGRFAWAHPPNTGVQQGDRPSKAFSHKQRALAAVISVQCNIM